jgi:hypothetical protein
VLIDRSTAQAPLCWPTASAGALRERVQHRRDLSCPPVPCACAHPAVFPLQANQHQQGSVISMDKDELLERYEALGKDEGAGSLLPEATRGAIITQCDGPEGAPPNGHMSGRSPGSTRASSSLSRPRRLLAGVTPTPFQRHERSMKTGGISELGRPARAARLGSSGGGRLVPGDPFGTPGTRSLGRRRGPGASRPLAGDTPARFRGERGLAR